MEANDMGDRVVKFWAELKAELERRCHKIELHERGNSSGSICGLTVDRVRLAAECAYQRRGYDYRITGKLRFSVGDYGIDRKSYPEPKAGFNISDCAERVLAAVDRAKERGAASKRRNDAREEAGALQRECGVPMMSVEADSIGRYRVTMHLNRDQVRAVAATLRPRDVADDALTVSA
jgi:hypothetical protein